MIEQIGNQQTPSRLTNARKEENLKEVFLKILTVELQNQNPLQPMENAEWISQLSQLHSLEQSENLANEIRSLRSTSAFIGAANLVGKEIAYKPDGAQQTTGVVGSVVQEGNQVVVVVDQRRVPLSNVISVQGERV